MPPSIDPITNLFGTGSSIFGRILVSFGAGWIGNFLSRVCASFTDWSDYKNPVSVLIDSFTAFGAVEILNIVLWPLILLHYLIDAPFYALLVIALILLCLVKIILADDPILFWAVLIITALTPGLVITNGNICSLVPLAFFIVGLGAALWYSVNLEHPEWIDWFRDKTGM